MYKAIHTKQASISQKRILFVRNGARLIWKEGVGIAGLFAPSTADFTSLAC